MWHFREYDRPDTETQEKLLQFVTDWLASDAAEDANRRVPRLFKLCAQRIAMSAFRRLVEEIDDNFTKKKLWYFTETFQKDMAFQFSMHRVPEFLKEYIIDEIYIFTIVYLLYTDLREWKGAEDCQLPIFVPHAGDPSFDEIVRNYGRGSLAKAGLYPYSAFIQMKASGECWPIDIIDEMTYKCERGFTTINHPFAVIVSIVPIISTLYAYYLMRDDHIEYIEDNVRKKYLPWAIPTETQHKDMKSLYPCMVKLVTFDASSIHYLDPFDENNCLYQQRILQHCVDMIDVVQEYGSPYFRSFCLPQDCLVPNIRFNGNYSKFELLHMAMSVRGAGVYTLDLEDCTNLDEECLEAILKCIRPRTLFLKGTPFDKNSPVLEKINSELEEISRITFSFQPRITKEKFDRRIKTLQDEKVSLEKDLDDMKERIKQESDERLRRENALMKKQIEMAEERSSLQQQVNDLLKEKIDKESERKCTIM